MFSKIFIDRPKLAMVISIVLVFGGILCMRNIPVAEYPEITPPTIMVIASYPGASSEEIADTIASPIEQEVNGLENMMYFSSESTNDGSYALTITFKSGTDDIADAQDLHVFPEPPTAGSSSSGRSRRGPCRGPRSGRRP